MDHQNKYRIKHAEQKPESVTIPGPMPGDFPLGSLQSRAAARKTLEQQKRSAKDFRFLALIPRPSWAPSWEECQGDDMPMIFTDDPELEDSDHKKLII
jgi:hypothetical protein